MSMTTGTAAMNKTEAILTFIQEFIAVHEYPPSVREIQQGLDISSTSVVNYHLKKLEALGAIERTPNRARSIVIKE